MDPLTIVFNSVSTLTGGLITDMTTAIIGMVGIGFLLMGIDYLKDILEEKINIRKFDQTMEKAWEYERLTHFGPKPERDYYQLKYKQALYKASKLDKY